PGPAQRACLAAARVIVAVAQCPAVAKKLFAGGVRRGQHLGWFTHSTKDTLQKIEIAQDLSEIRAKLGAPSCSSRTIGYRSQLVRCRLSASGSSARWNMVYQATTSTRRIQSGTMVSKK